MNTRATTTTLTTLLFLTTICAVAAPKSKPGEKPARHARILAVGDSPPFLQEVRDGVRYELEPPPDSLPPREVLPGFGKDTGKSIPLHLGRISPASAVPDGAGPLDLRRTGETAESTPWVRINRPETGDFMILLWRDPKGKNWSAAANLIVPDGPLGTPAGTIRIINLYPQAVRIQWGDESLRVNPRDTVLRMMNTSTDVPFQILIHDPSGTRKRYYSGNVTQNAGERGIITIYRADGEAPRRPLKVAMLREPAAP